MLYDTLKSNKYKCKIVISVSNKDKIYPNDLLFEGKRMNKQKFSKFIKNIMKLENIKIKNINDHVYKHGNNMRMCINRLEDDNREDNFFEENNAKRITNDLLQSQCNEEIHSLCNTSSVIISACMYENFLDTKLSTQDIYKISEHIIDFDILYSKSFSQKNAIKYIEFTTCRPCKYILQNRMSTKYNPKLISKYSTKCSKIQYNSLFLSIYPEFNFSQSNVLLFRKILMDYLLEPKTNKNPYKSIFSEKQMCIQNVLKLYSLDTYKLLIGTKEKKIFKTLIS